jgi:hypothetical protein
MTKAYASYVQSGKAFLETWVEEECVNLDFRLKDMANSVQEERSIFQGAFDIIGSQTPVALRLLTAYKCDHQGKGFLTAEGIQSAFKLYFERCVYTSESFLTDN